MLPSKTGASVDVWHKISHITQLSKTKNLLARYATRATIGNVDLIIKLCLSKNRYIALLKRILNFEKKRLRYFLPNNGNYLV